jgi:retinol dehydrogenase-12
LGVSVEQGAKNQLWAATADGVASGVYYVPVGVSGKEGKLLKDKDLIRSLWEWTEKELEGHVI